MRATKKNFCIGHSSRVKDKYSSSPPHALVAAIRRIFELLHHPLGSLTRPSGRVRTQQFAFKVMRNATFCVLRFKSVQNAAICLQINAERSNLL